MLKVSSVGINPAYSHSVSFGTNKLVYVCSSLASDYNPDNSRGIDLKTHIRENMVKAACYSKEVIANGDLPVLLHDKAEYLADDSIPAERARILKAGRELVRQADAVCVFGTPIGGMVDEIKIAKKSGIPVITPDDLPKIDKIVGKTLRYKCKKLTSIFLKLLNIVR